MMLIVLICAIVVGLTATFLIFHKQYIDGLVGRFGLAVVAIAGYSRAAHLLETGTDIADVSRVGVMIWIGVTLFLTSHAWSFWRRCKRRDRTWYDADSSVIWRPMRPVTELDRRSHQRRRGA